MSSSDMLSTCSPLTKIWPPSGLSRPRINRRIVDLPAPLAPRKILVCPVFSVKLTPLRMTFSSNDRLHVVEHDDRAAGAERFVEQFRTRGRLGARHQYINTMSSCVTR